MAGRIPPAGSRENGPNAAQGALVLGCVIHDMGDSFIADQFLDAVKYIDKDHYQQQAVGECELVNVFNSIKELIRNKRIAAEKNAAETSEDAPVAK